jgi:hypothetical protein
MAFTLSNKAFQNVVLPILSIGTVLLVIFWPAAKEQTQESESQAETEQATTQTDATAEPVAEEPTTTAPTTTYVKPKSSGLTYEEAVELYGGFRFQFASCSGVPGTMTIKKGSSVMLDNRDGKAHTIAVGSKKYTLTPYGFAIATPTETGLLYVTCDGGGAAQLTVQP